MSAALSLGLFGACGGPTVERGPILTRLREALTADVSSAEQMEDNNQLVENVRDGNVMPGMRRSEVRDALGPGQDCGSRALCSDHGYAPTDWVYEVGERDGLPAGPTLVVGFDRTGVVDGVFSFTRR